MDQYLWTWLTTQASELWTNINFWPPIFPGLMLICWMTFYKLILISGLQVGEMQPSYVPLLEVYWNWGNQHEWWQLYDLPFFILISYNPSTRLLLLRCFCFCKKFFKIFNVSYLIPSRFTHAPKIPKAKGTCSAIPFFSPRLGAQLSVRQCSSPRCSEVCWRTSGASGLQDTACSVLAARMWPGFLLNGSALRRKVPNQHSSAADTAQADCLQSLEPLSPWGSVIEIISFARSRWDLLCKSPLPLCKVTSVRRGNHSLLDFAVLSSLSGCP